jgi:hypothetical protein
MVHYAVRDMISWAIANGFKWFRSSGLNHGSKLQMRHLLDPTDLYVRHRSVVLNGRLENDEVSRRSYSGLRYMPTPGLDFVKFFASRANCRHPCKVT